MMDSAPTRSMEGCKLAEETMKMISNTIMKNSSKLINSKTSVIHTTIMISRLFFKVNLILFRKEKTF